MLVVVIANGGNYPEAPNRKLNLVRSLHHKAQRQKSWLNPDPMMGLGSAIAREPA